MNKKPVKIILLISIVVAIAFLIYFTRPGEQESKSLEKTTGIAKKDDVIDKFGSELSKTKAPDNDIKKDAPDKGPDQKFTSGDYEIQRSYSEHGKNAIVRVSGGAKVRKSREYPVVEPNWEEPLSLTFEGLKKIYIYAKVNSAFPEGIIRQMNGSAVEIVGTVMPADQVPENGEMLRFWLANPYVVLAGCVFCNAPTMGDLIFVTVPFGVKPLKVDREQLFTRVVIIRLKGRLFFGPQKTADGMEYLFGIEYSESQTMKL